MAPLVRVERILATIERIMLALASAALAVIALVITADVFCRYALASPLPFAAGLIQIYLFPCAVLFALASVQRIGENVNVDVFVRHFPAAVLRGSGVIVLLVGAAASAIIAYHFGKETAEALRSGEVIFGAILWPTWPSKAIVAVGFALLGCRTAIQALCQILSPPGGRPGAGSAAAGSPR